MRSAIVALRSVGRASASSNPFVCRLCAAAAHRRECLQGHPDDVVLGLLRGQRRAAGLRVEPQHLAARIGRAEPVAHDARPHRARSSELRDLLEDVVVGVEEEREPARERVDLEARVDGRLDVGDAVGQRECELLRSRRAGLADVVAGDRDRVPARHPLGAVAEGVHGQAHARPGREDVVAAGDVLLEDVVLDGARQPVGRDALAGRDQLVQQHQQRRRRVDRHRRRHVAQRDPVEQALHVLQRVDGDAGAADLAAGQLVVGIEPQLGRQVEGHRQAGLAALEQQVEALVGLVRGAESGVLAHRPGARPVPVGAHPAGVRELAGSAAAGGACAAV